MESEELCCRLCKNLYNLTNRLPRTMANCCGEAICSSCIESMLKKTNEFRCPFDGTSYVLIDSDVDAFLVNPTIKRLVERNMIKKEGCNQHSQPFTFKCLPCQTRLCNTCIHYGFHKGHDLQSLDQSYNEIIKKKDELELKMNELAKLHKKMETLMINNQKSFLELVEARFQRIRERLADQEKRFSAEIKAYFSGEKAKIQNSLGADSHLNKEAQDILNRLNKSLDNGLSNFPKLMTEAIPKFDQLLQQDLSKVYSQKLESFYRTFDGSLKTRADQLFSLGLPFNNVPETSFVLESSGSPSQLSKMPPYFVKSEFPFEEDQSGKENRSKVNAPQVELSEINQYLRLRIRDGRLVVLPKNSISKKDSANILFDVDKWKNASKVDFRLGGYDLSVEALRSLRWISCKLQNLTELKVDFIYEGVLDDQLIKLAGSVFEHLDQLEELHIDLKNCKVGDEGFSFVVDKFLSKMKNLRGINLNLSHTKISHKSLSPLFQTLQPMMKNLEVFQLFLSKLSLEDQSVTSLMIPMSNLKKLTLDLSFVKAPDNVFEGLLKESIQSMKVLEEFEIDVSYTDISDQNLMYIFASLPLLRNFDLRLERTTLTDKSLNAFLERSLSKMEYIEELAINIKQTCITSKSLDALIRHIPKVKALRLLIGGKFINDVNFETLGNRLNAMKSLEVLELDVEKAKVQEQSISKIFLLLPNVKNLSLNFGNTSFGDKNLKMFTENTLKYLKSLKKIKLVLSGTQITDEGLKKLLIGMQDVKVFKLYLRNTKITDAGVEMFIKNHHRILKSLEEFEMDLKNTKVSSLLSDEAEKIAKRLPRRNLNP